MQQPQKDLTICNLHFIFFSTVLPPTILTTLSIKTVRCRLRFSSIITLQSVLKNDGWELDCFFPEKSISPFQDSNYHPQEHFCDHKLFSIILVPSQTFPLLVNPLFNLPHLFHLQRFSIHTSYPVVRIPFVSSLIDRL